ncbi:metal-dependent transcriptional regulator [Demequina sp. B12]|uniref:metal-dependent transcriptional regulator n=1 Tax=Demequina sp. B12 TaxID=2992757 RepID=UPI00237B841D|nr:metal-dependent transcriptional regulator [Demequina sp. B12]MDE0571995.1 metal-dependent transcriptional regulator [Demequina sp. B12]
MAGPTVTEDYLKAIFNAAEWSEGPVTVTALSQRLALSPSSVSEVVKKLASRGLITHQRYGSISLTPEGEQIALATVRKHRLIETFLVDYLGYGWHEVHDEAEVLEHAVSDTFVERLAEKLGQPTHDPHGDPIPTAAGVLPEEELTAIPDVPSGTQVRIARVWDDDPELLQHLRGVGLDIGTELTVAAQHPAAGTVELTLDGATVSLGLPAARAILTAAV